MTESFGQFGLAMLLGILAIYMVLAAQFESLIHPLTVMLAVPLAMVGALGGLLIGGMTLSIFSLIGIILLFGLVTKNSILLVDYANQLRAGGMDKVEAMRTAAPIRMRPVLMTALSMILGVLPAALGIGPGAETRAPMAVATAAGMFSSMVLTLVVIPVFYVVLDDFAECPPPPAPPNPEPRLAGAIGRRIFLASAGLVLVRGDLDIAHSARSHVVAAPELGADERDPRSDARSSTSTQTFRELDFHLASRLQPVGRAGGRLRSRCAPSAWGRARSRFRRDCEGW